MSQHVKTPKEQVEGPQPNGWTEVVRKLHAQSKQARDKEVSSKRSSTKLFSIV